MKTVEAWCPVCGDCELRPTAVSAVTYPEGAGDFYAFTCPTCGDWVPKPADAETIALLRSGGVKIMHVEMDCMQLVPALSLDDLIDLGQELEHYNAGHVSL